MRILVFGAAGSVGSRIVAEALSRGHEVTAVVRRPEQLSALPRGVSGVIGDASNADQVEMLCASQDLAISATRPPQGRETELVETAKSLLAGVAQAGVRMILVGGAASLRVPDTGGLALDDPRYVPTFVRDIALACLRQSEVCAAERQADWTYMSPPPQLVPGVRTGRYRLAQDELLLDSEGKSTISMEDFAVALLDEAESPKHHRSSFTVAADPFDTTEREFAVETPDGSADCYFIHPEHGSHPGVIIWPDVLSLRPAFQTIGKQIAQCGYAVLVINPYYRTTAAPIGIDASSFAEPAGREKAFQLAKAITPAMTASDTVALVDYLDGQEAVDSNRKLGVAGYCMGGSMAIRSAAARPDRVGAVASFHGGNLVTNEPSSPHLLVADSRANALIAIAQSDHDKEPDTQTALEEAFGGAKLPAEIEVYEGTAHGWCVPDAKAYDQPEADRALSRLLALFGTALR